MDTITRTPSKLFSGTCSKCGARKTENYAFEDDFLAVSCTATDADGECYGSVGMSRYTSQAELDAEIETEQLIRDHEDGLL